MAMVHIYGARAISLIFSNHQDAQSESQEMEMSTSQPIFTHKKISKALWDNGIHTLQYWRNIVVIVNIYGASAILVLFYISKILNLNNDKWKLVYLDQYQHIKIPKAL